MGGSRQNIKEEVRAAGNGSMFVRWCVSRNAGGFPLQCAERIRWKDVGQGIEAPSWIRRKQRQAEMTEQEVAEYSQGPRVSVGAMSRWTSLGPWDLAQNRCASTICWLADKVMDRVTAESSERGVGSKGGEEWAEFRCFALLGPEAGQPYPRAVRGGSHVLPAECCPSAQVLVPRVKHWKSAAHWYWWPDTGGQFSTALCAAAGGESG